MRQSCSPDPAHVAKASVRRSTGSDYVDGRSWSESHAHHSSSHEEDHHTTEKHNYDIKISSVSDMQKSQQGDTHTPKRPPRYAVVTPDEDLLDAMHTHSVAAASTEPAVFLRDQYKKDKSEDQVTPNTCPTEAMASDSRFIEY